MKITAEGKLQSAYAKRGYFLTFRSNGQYIISDKDRPLRGNLKLYSRDVIDNVDETIAEYERMAKEVEATDNPRDAFTLLRSFEFLLDVVKTEAPIYSAHIKQAEELIQQLRDQSKGK